MPSSRFVPRSLTSLAVASLATAVALAAASLVAGCGDTAPPPVHRAADSFRLERVGATSLGLGYGDAHPLLVRYLDGDGRPVGGATVRFGIFGDPAGSTLSADRATTGDDGAAQVSLTAGAAEATFRVMVSAPSAPDVGFDVSVSRFSFFELDARLVYGGADADRIASIEARLYDQRRCSQVVPASPLLPLPPALRTRAATTAGATLPFAFLLGMDYAVAGRAFDADGHTFATGCVDVLREQLVSSAPLVVPVPLERALPSVTGSWAARLEVAVKGQAALLPSWAALGACPLAPAQQLLDALVDAAGPGPLTAAIAGLRGAPDGNGCRPSTVKGVDSLDRELRQLLGAKGAPDLAGVLADVAAIAASVEIDSRLDLAPGAAPDLFVATHRIDRATLHGGSSGATASYDLGALGLPVVVAEGMAAKVTATTLTLGPHAFTLRLPSLWRRALGDLALGPRKLPTAPRDLVRAIVDVALRPGSHQALTGCAAVEDLVCAKTAHDPCALVTACAVAIDAIGARLAAELEPRIGADFTLTSGAATLPDGGGKPQLDTLVGGHFDADVFVSPTRHLPAAVPWIAERIH